MTKYVPQLLAGEAIGLMSLTLAVSIVFFVRPAWLQALLAVFGVLLAIWLYRTPSRED